MANIKLTPNKVRCRNLDPLRTVLSHIKKGDLKDVEASLTPELQPVFQDRLSQPRVPKDYSPLVAAVQNNRKDVLLYILNHYEANLEQETSTYIEGGHPVEGATPLWTASTLGYFDIVRELVGRGADISHTTDSRSSPLRGAAFDGHLSVVQYLVEKGADIDKPNQVGQSPLTIAAAMQKIETVKYLLEKGANIHHKGHNGDTPLHVAVESGSEKITKLLVEAGAKNTPNDVGYTPAIMASCYGHQDIMNYLNNTFVLPPSELYNCYCLLVTKEVLNTNISGANKMLKMAVELRKNHPNAFKDLQPTHPIYNGIKEPTTDSEVDEILQDDMLSFFLCAVYCERILGPIHPTTPFYIRISGDMALEEKKYDKCMKLWLRSLEFDKAARMAYELQIIEDLLFSVRGFSIMLDAGFVPEVAQHFQWGMKEFHLAKDSKIAEIDVIYCLCRLLAVWVKAVDMMTDLHAKSHEKTKLQSAVKQLCELVDKQPFSLLTACLKNLPKGKKLNQTSAISSIFHSKLPLFKVINLFLNSGCSISCEDSIGNYPLHLAVQMMEDSALDCVKTLVENGAHLDAVNHLEQTPLDLARAKCGYKKQKDAIVQFLLASMKEQLSLQCLAAKAITTYAIDYASILPPFLVSFVAEHHSDGLGEDNENNSGTRSASVSSDEDSILTP